MSIEFPQSGMHSVLLFENNLIRKNTHFKFFSEDSRYYSKDDISSKIDGKLLFVT